jgi:ubiquinone/menaquinone biosynthesis C-methylase UbiE
MKREKRAINPVETQRKEDHTVIPPLRTGRRKYYDRFSPFYDAFIKIHSRRHGDTTRSFLVQSAQLEGRSCPRILDLCCGTGEVLLAFARHYPGCVKTGCDFSRGMLAQTRKKTGPTGASLVQGDAAALPFSDNSFDVVTCSHALYELKGDCRKKSLLEMKRVIRDKGVVLLMEHAVPENPVVKILFYLRMFMMGSADAREFVKSGTKPFKDIFSRVSLSYTPSKKTRLFSCRKTTIPE